MNSKLRLAGISCTWGDPRKGCDVKTTTSLFLISLVFFLSAGVFFVIGYGWLAALDAVLGLAVGGFALQQRSKGR